MQPKPIRLLLQIVRQHHADSCPNQRMPIMPESSASSASPQPDRTAAALPAYVRSPELLVAARSQLLVIDMQERLTPVIANSKDVVRRCRQLITAAGIMSVPCLVTEQYPRGLGPTVAELADLLPSPLEKLRFSAAEVLLQQPGFEAQSARDQCLLIGIEAHVCVLQTALDLLAHGFRVSVVADATGSRRESDRGTALRRMADSGVTITSSESVLFEWCEVAGTREFKQISTLIRDL